MCPVSQLSYSDQKENECIRCLRLIETLNNILRSLLGCFWMGGCFRKGLRIRKAGLGGCSEKEIEIKELPCLVVRPGHDPHRDKTCLLTVALFSRITKTLHDLLLTIHKCKSKTLSTSPSFLFFASFYWTFLKGNRPSNQSHYDPTAPACSFPSQVKEENTVLFGPLSNENNHNVVYQTMLLSTVENRKFRGERKPELESRISFPPFYLADWFVALITP